MFLDGLDATQKTEMIEYLDRLLSGIGNEAVHPGVMDLRDDRDTAFELFGLVNSIADQMITHPKAVETLYEKLPENKREAIEARDRKA